MYNSSKLLLLLVNIFFNLGIINPGLQETKLYSTSKAILHELPISSPFRNDAELLIDQVMKDYAVELVKIHHIEEHTEAIVAMQKARKVFLQRAKLIAFELENQLQGMSQEEAQLFKEKQLLKPYFKQINDARSAYLLSGRLEKDAELKKAFLAMDEFMSLLYK